MYFGEFLSMKIAISSLPKHGWWNEGIKAYHDNDMMSDGAIPNQSLLKKEHEGLIKILNKHCLDTVSITFGDCHIYSEHSEQVNTQLSRTPYQLPQLELTNFKTIEDVEQATTDDFKLIDYSCYPGIKAKMIA